MADRLMAMRQAFTTCAGWSLAVIFFLSSCAAPAPPQKKLGNQKFSSVALVTPSDVVRVSAGERRSEKLKEGLVTGAATGSLGGVLVGAAVCGPYLYGLCAIGLGAVGMVAGGAGGVVYGYSGINDEVAAKLEKKVELLVRVQDLQKDLVAQVTSLVPQEVFSKPEDAEVQALLVLENIRFFKAAGKIHVETVVRLSFASRESRRVQEIGSQSFVGRSATDDVALWLDEDSTQFESAIKENLEDISREVASIVLSHWSPSAGVN